MPSIDASLTLASELACSVTSRSSLKSMTALSPFERDPGDRSRLDAGHAYLVAGPDARSVDELGLVAGVGRLERTPRHEDEEHEGYSDDECLACRGSHRHGLECPAPGRSGSLDCGRAEVEGADVRVEPRPVAECPVEAFQQARGVLERGGEQIVVRDDRLAQLGEAGECGAQRPGGLVEQAAERRCHAVERHDG